MHRLSTVCCVCAQGQRAETLEADLQLRALCQDINMPYSDWVYGVGSVVRV